jgi:hypothetical protein
LEILPGSAESTLPSEIGNIYDFKNLDQVAAWAGFVPSVNNQQASSPLVASLSMDQTHIPHFETLDLVFLLLLI